jgi:hypothetical protein
MDKQEKSTSNTPSSTSSTHTGLKFDYICVDSALFWSTSAAACYTRRLAVVHTFDTARGLGTTSPLCAGAHAQDLRSHRHHLASVCGSSSIKIFESADMVFGSAVDMTFEFAIMTFESADMVFDSISDMKFDPAS